MSREIKYRAWLKNRNKMVEVEEIDFLAQKQIAYDEIEYRYTDKEPFHYTQWVDFDEIELLQYVELKDKNNIEIYDGYILQNEQGRKFVIEYKFGGFNLVPIEYYKDEFSWNAMGDMQCAGFIQESCKIIGNVYQNKELLENEKED